MIFGRKKSSGGDADPAELQRQISNLGETEAACRAAIRTLLVLLKEFALDLEELKSQEFREQVGALENRVTELDNGSQLKREMGKRAPRFQAFIQRQNHYLTERESELRNVITLLSNAMALLNRENAAYHQKILDQGQNFERIIGLDDLRRIKTSLAEEVRQLKTMVEQKKRAEQQQLHSLTGEVKELREDLDRTRNENRRDPLTAIYNRRALDEYLQGLIDQNQIKRKRFAVLLLDIDDFKAVNDTHGHLVGDQVLRAMAGACTDTLREDDFIARYGGEEFVAVMPGASLRAAHKRANGLCKAVAGTRFSLPADDHEEYLQLTISVGVTEFQSGDTMTSLLERADQALYQAKHNGKNQVSSIRYADNCRPVDNGKPDNLRV